MTNTNSKILFGQGAGEGLDWAVQYAEAMEVVLKGRRDKRPLKADIAQISEAMKDAIITQWNAEQLLSAVITRRIACFEDCGQWYAIPSDEIARHTPDQDGAMPKAMIYEEDVSQGDTCEMAVKRCYVKMVLGSTINVPDDLI